MNALFQSTRIPAKVFQPAIRLCLLLAAALSLASCNIVAPVAYLIEGPAKTPAVFTLDPARKTVIFIDDRSSEIPKRSLRFQIGQAAEADMLAQGVIDEGKLISSRSAARVAANESAGELMSIVEIGRELGAEVVIYVEVEVFRLSRDSASLSPTAGAMVKVIDAENNQRLFPDTAAPYPLKVQMPERAAALPRTRTEMEAMHEALATYFGIQISRMFYPHERDPLSEQREL